MKKTAEERKERERERFMNRGCVEDNRKLRVNRGALRATTLDQTTH